MSEFNSNDYLNGIDDVESLKNSDSDSDAFAKDNSHKSNKSEESSSFDSLEKDSVDKDSVDKDSESREDKKEDKKEDKAEGNKEDNSNSDSHNSNSSENSDEKSSESQCEKSSEGSEESTLTPLGKAKKEAAEYLEALQRERAEFINFRNRASKEQDRFRQHGIIDVLSALLPALDDIDRIREHSDMDDSFKAVAAKLDKAFEKFGVEKFGEKGEDFDPTKHDAVLHRPDPNATKETVDAVVEAGYRIGDRVIRAARVVVASPNNA